MKLIIKEKIEGFGKLFNKLMYMNFTKEEYKTRLKKVQKSMQEKGIELLISQ